MNLKRSLSQYWEKIQGSLFPHLEEVLPSLTAKQQQLIRILELIRIEEFVPSFCSGFRGRPELSRKAIVRAFIAKSVYNMPTTVMLIERLHSDISLRRICGWECQYEIPSKSVFSRAFAEFTRTELPIKAHEALIQQVYANEIIDHVVTDASAIEVREKPIKKQVEKIAQPKAGRPRKGEKRSKSLSRIEKQAAGMTLEEMLQELPKACDKGAKTNSKGNLNWWIGYKLHLTSDANGVPLAGIVTSASLHDSQAAIPLARLTDKRVKNFYDLMDAGYYSDKIIEHSKSLGHVPIIEKGAKSPEEKESKRMENLARQNLKWKPAEMVRYASRTVVERVFSRLKDEFGANFVRVKGNAKVSTHLMFGVLALTADQLFKLIL